MASDSDPIVESVLSPDKIDYLIRAGLGDPNRLVRYRSAFQNPARAMTDPTVRPYLVELCAKLFRLVVEDQQIYTRIRWILQTTMHPGLKESALVALDEKAEESGWDVEILTEVFSRGFEGWSEKATPHLSAEQVGFNRVNAFIAGNPTVLEADSDLFVEETEQ